MLAFTVNFPSLSPDQANATFQQRFRAAVARAAQVATDAVAITLASPGVVISALKSPGVTLGTEVTFPESNSTTQADAFGGTLASGGSSAIVEAGEGKKSIPNFYYFFGCFFLDTPFFLSSLAHALHFFYFGTKKLTPPPKTKNRSSTHSQRKTPGSSLPTGPSRSRR